MRNEGEFRAGTVVKPELIEEFLSDISVIFEDRESVVNKWRQM